MRWFNLGLWDDAEGVEEASRALAHRLADAAGLRPGQEVFDAGCGFGGQLEVWLDRDVARVVAVDASPGRVRRASAFVRALPRGDRVTVSCARLAGDLGPDLGGRFDRVLSLDAAYHFDTRQRFLHQAARSLRPGGRLAMVDLVLSARGQDLLGTRQRAMLSRMTRVPAANLVDEATWRAQIASAGFDSISVEPLHVSVLRGFVEHVAAGGWRAFSPRWWPAVWSTARLLAWGLARDAVRCPLLVATRTNPGPDGS